MAFGPGFGAGFGPGFARVQGDDTVPDDFILGHRTGVPPSTLIYSAPFTVTGINVASPWSITPGGEISINGGAYESAGGNVNNGDVVIVRITSDADPGDTVSTTLTIGGVNGVFMVTTRNDAQVTPFPRKGGCTMPPLNASTMMWAYALARAKNKARRRAAQGG